MEWALLLLAVLGLVGHGTLWTMLVNRSHALGVKRRWVHLATALCLLALAIIPLCVAGVLWRVSQGDVTPSWRVAALVAWSYIAACTFIALAVAIQRLGHTWHPERHGIVHANHTTRIDVRDQSTARLTAPGFATWLSWLPGNQALEIHFHEKHLTLDRMPAGSAPLRIAHLSDLHMSGRITQSYFAEVVQRVNELEPDLIAVTGDLVERNECVEWIPATLGRLRAAGGVYYVLGNHDVRVDQQLLRAVLADTPLIHLGGKWHEAAIGATSLALAGNESPWYEPPAAPDKGPPRAANGLPLRILLAHGPDQFAWAQQHDFDLMLAGHNHGGQVRLPLVGPVVAPSLSGVRYASGTFRAGRTVMHVSRGTSSLTPFRWNCPPEVTLLVLHSPT